MNLQKNNLKLFISLILLVNIIFLGSNQIMAAEAESLSIEKAIEFGTKNNRQLENIRYNIAEIESQLNGIESINRLHLFVNGNSKYIDGIDNQYVNNSTFENGSQIAMEINLSKKLNPRHDISASLQVNDSNSSGLNELKEKYNFSLDLNSNLYPIIPTKNEVNQHETLNRLKAEKSKLNNQIMVKNIEWIERFLNLSKYKSKIKLSKDRLRLEKKLLERTLSQKEIGEAGELDILTARIRVQEAELILQNLINNQNEIKNKLITDLGLTNKTLKLNADEEKVAFIKEKIKKKIKNTEIDLTDKSDLFKRLVKYNYQLENLKTSKDLANKKIKWEKKDRGLDISTNIGYNYNQKVKDDYWEIAFKVSYEILDGGTAKNKLTDRKRESEKIKKDYNYTLKKLKLDLDKMIEQYLTAKNNYSVYQMKHEKAKLQLDKSKIKLKDGVITRDEIKRKEILFKETKIELEEARDNILIEKLKIIQFVGLY